MSHKAIKFEFLSFQLLQACACLIFIFLFSCNNKNEFSYKNQGNETIDTVYVQKMLKVMDLSSDLRIHLFTKNSHHDDSILVVLDSLKKEYPEGLIQWSEIECEILIFKGKYSKVDSISTVALNSDTNRYSPLLLGSRSLANAKNGDCKKAYADLNKMDSNDKGMFLRFVNIECDK